MKKTVSFILTLAMMLTFVFVAVPLSKADAELFLEMPDNDGKTDNTSYTIGQGTEDQVNVTCKFIPTSKSWRPGTVQVQKYIVIHNTDNWKESANAQSHNSYLRTGTNVGASYAYVVGSDGIYQNLPDLENSWHTGTNKLGTGINNSNAIGIETCDAGAPLKSNGLPDWNTQALYDWYENQFAQRVGYVAMLAAMLCVRYDFNPYTQVYQHFDVYGKECPREMRYVFGTTTDVGSRTDGTYWLIFWDKLIRYYNAFGGKYTGYTTGKYVTTISTPLYASASRDASSLKSVPASTTISVTEIDGYFGKVSYNGSTGWVYLQTAVCQDVKGSNGIVDDGTGVYRFNYYENDTMNLRSTPSTSGTKLTEIPRDGKTTITVTELSDTWGKTMYNGYTGWVNVSSTYATKISGLNLKAPTLTAPELAYAGDDFDVSWEEVPGASHYKIKAALADDESVVIKTVDVTRDLSVTISGAPGGKVLKVGVATVTLEGEKWSYAEVLVKNKFFIVNDAAITADDGYVTGVKENITGTELKAKFDNDVKVVASDGSEITDGLVGTGCKVQAFDDTNAMVAEYVVVIKGDLDGDGKVTVSDYLAVKFAFKRAEISFSETVFKAADTAENEKITVSDYILIKRHVQKSFDLFA